MDLGSLVFAYYWWHHSVSPFKFTAQRDDRSGWQLNCWCNAPVVLKATKVKTLDGKLTEVAIVARQDHPDIEVEVLAEMLSDRELILHPFPRWKPGVGDVVVIQSAPYDDWYYAQCSKHKYQLFNRTKVYSKDCQAWRKKYDCMNLDVVCAKYRIKSISGQFAVLLRGTEEFRIPIDCLAVLEKLEKQYGLAA